MNSNFLDDADATGDFDDDMDDDLALPMQGTSAPARAPPAQESRGLFATGDFGSPVATVPGRIVSAPTSPAENMSHT